MEYTILGLVFLGPSIYGSYQVPPRSMPTARATRIYCLGCEIPPARLVLWVSGLGFEGFKGLEVMVERFRA